MPALCSGPDAEVNYLGLASRQDHKQGSLGKQCTLGAQGDPGRECREFPWRR